MAPFFGPPCIPLSAVGLFLLLVRRSETHWPKTCEIRSVRWTVTDSHWRHFYFHVSTSVFSALEVCYENALYKFTFDIDIDIACDAWLSCPSRVDVRTASLLDVSWANKWLTYWLVDWSNGLWMTDVPFPCHQRAALGSVHRAAATECVALSCVWDRRRLSAVQTPPRPGPASASTTTIHQHIHATVHNARFPAFRK